jgi:hypothetical protein
MVARLARLVVLSAVLLAGAAAVAHAADVGPRYACYTTHRGASFTLLGSGFLPGSLVHVHLGSRSLPDARADLEGRVKKAYDLPGLAASRHSQGFSLTASDGSSTARSVLRVTRFDVGIAPASGKPRRRVRLALYGWFGKTVWVHYVGPHAHHASRTVRVGRTRGACGELHTHLNHLYPFRPRAGVWRLQFDTEHAYRAHRTPSIVIFGRVTPAR